jgi:hypothetical protein
MRLAKQEEQKEEGQEEEGEEEAEEMYRSTNFLAGPGTLDSVDPDHRTHRRGRS